ncbi:hypothetical protein H0I76_16545 [Limibaculum sp. M0105]|uniref:Uncharacterized protein n=1 Tax=Thermohalobaculum xanthum TaxID=2753746 RepID=A0A8J7M8W5_9RHOB|nr:hypothetical protein [Thermohalobaculum xanthum]MBK0400811.1 hypothetical protein [Thermohalobaculum xanthum]
MPHRSLVALTLLSLATALAGCEIDQDLPFGGSFTMSPTQPMPGGNYDASGGAACVGINERGQRTLLARSRCAGDDDGAIRAP